MRLRRTITALVPLAVAATAVGSVVLLSGTAQAASGTAATKTAARSTIPAAIAQQTLKWVECFPGAGFPELQCAGVTVPRDWAKPSGPTLTIAVSRIKATDPAKRRGVLFSNPGGPGGSGLTLPLLFEQNEPDVQAVYDTIGFDPRGVGSSTELNCGQGDTLDTLYNLDGRDTSAANQAEIKQLNITYAKQCASDPLTPYITTDQTVQDVDLVRSLLGESKINYLGYSYGTSLGTWYAARFPSRVDRFVLDGNVTWAAKSSYTGALMQPLGFQNSFDNFFEPWAAKYNSVYGLGSTKKAVDATYEKRRAALAKHPLTLADGSQLTASGYDSGIGGGMYWIGYYDELATVLQIVEHYDTATADQQAEVTDWFASVSGNGDDVFWSVECQDTPQPSYSRVVQDTGVFRKIAPLIGANWNVYPCPFLGLPTGQTPVVAGKLPKLLMVQNTDDPATPYPGGLIDHAAAKNTRLITVKNEPDHTIYASGSDCVDSKVNNWLINGVLPSSDVSCAGLPLPTPAPLSASSASLKKAAAAKTKLNAWAWVAQFTKSHGKAKLG